MELLQNLLESSRLPALSAFLLGLMTAVSPCPLATNITAIGYISKDITNRQSVFRKGLAYTAGRAITYTVIGLLFYFGASQFEFSGFIQRWGEKLLGPLLISIGLFMLGVFSFKIPGTHKLQDRVESRARNGFSGALLLGVVFALAFCPYSGVLYFGILIPMTIASSEGLILPAIFALATGIPVLLLAWIIAFSLGSIGTIYNKIKAFESWFRRVVAVLFISTGLYFLIILYV